MHDGLSRRSRETIQKIHPNCIFKDFTKEYMEERLKAALNDLPHLPDPNLSNIINRYSHFYFAKFEIFDLLNDYEEVLWLDSDMLIVGSIMDIITEKPISWRPNGFELDGPFEKIVHGVGFANFQYSAVKTKPNGGLIFVRSSVRKKYGISTHYAYKIALGCLTYTNKTTIDEWVLGIIAHYHKIPVHECPKIYNHPSWGDGVDQAIIIHAVGSYKFWNSRAHEVIFPEWLENEKKWLSLGGTAPQKKYMEKTFPHTKARIIKFAKNYDLWIHLYALIRDDLPLDIMPDIIIHRNFYQLYIRDIDKKIHYELSSTSNDRKIILALHCENKELMKTSAWKDFIAQHIFILKNKYNFQLLISDTVIGFEITILRTQLKQAFLFLYEQTIDFIKLHHQTK